MQKIQTTGEQNRLLHQFSFYEITARLQNGLFVYSAFLFEVSVLT